MFTLQHVFDAGMAVFGLATLAIMIWLLRGREQSRDTWDDNWARQQAEAETEVMAAVKGDERIVFGRVVQKATPAVIQSVEDVKAWGQQQREQITAWGQRAVSDSPAPAALPYRGGHRRLSS